MAAGSQAPSGRPWPTQPLEWTSRGAARLYLLFALPMLLTLNFVFVPFHAPDDYDHVKRAYALAHGALLPVTRPGELSGGYVDASLVRMIERQKPAVHDWSRTGSLASRAAPHDRPPTAWSGIPIFSEFPGSASYMPLVYLPQAVMLRLGEAFSLSVERSVFLARIFNGGCAALVISVALSRMPYGIGIALFLLFLPKTLVQFASNSLDPILHALTFLVVAVATRSLVHGRALRLRHYLLLALCLLALAGARPPLAALILLPLWLAWRQRNPAGAVVLVAAVVGAAAWFAVVMPMIVDTRCGPTGTFGDKFLAFLAGGPLLVARSVWWFKQYYLGSFVGELGWGNGPRAQMDWLPRWVYVAAAITAALAVAHDMTQAVRPAAAWRGVLVAAAAAVALSIFFVMYLGCTRPGALAIEGVQGRYFFTSALLCASALSGVLRPIGAVHRLYPLVLASFALCGFGSLLAEGLRIYWTN